MSTKLVNQSIASSSTNWMYFFGNFGFGGSAERLRESGWMASTSEYENFHWSFQCQPRNFHFCNSKNCWWCGEHTWLWWLLNQLTSTAEKNQQLFTWSHLDLHLDMFFMHFKIWEQLQIFWLGAPGRRLGALLEDQLPCCATLTGSTRFNYIINYYSIIVIIHYTIITVLSRSPGLQSSIM